MAADRRATRQHTGNGKVWHSHPEIARVFGILERTLERHCREEVQAGGAMLLIFAGAVANFPEPMNKGGACRVARRSYC